MKSRYRVGFLSVLPSPYQRDIFAALARRDDVDLRVYYLAAGEPDSPWPDKPLPPGSEVLPGFLLQIGSGRCHVAKIPYFHDRDIVVLNSIVSATAQYLMRFGLRDKPWVFWGERFANRAPSWRDTARNLLTAPLHDASAIASIGSLAVRQYTARFPEPPNYDIPYHCDLAPFFDTPKNQPSPGELVFLFCGQMIKRKGLDHLLAAFTAVAARHPHVRLLLAGREAELPALLNEVPEPIRARIEFIGFKPPEDLPAVFARADVFILPSRFDGWGVVVNQAIAASLPLICSETVGAAQELLIPEENGLRFPPGDIPALTACMERFATNPTLAKTWGAASRKIANDWTPDKGAEKWVTLFRDILHGKRSSVPSH